jgi:hypothetical protein
VQEIVSGDGADEFVELESPDESEG